MAFPWLAVASIAASLISKKSSSKSSDDSSASTSSDGGNNFSTYLAYANGIKNLLSNNSQTQYGYQAKLLGLQNQYAQQNASIAYNRQRSLTQDTPLLNMLGLRAAGINPSTAGGTTATAASVNQASAGSTPNGPDVNGAENTKIAALQAIQQAETQQKQNQLIDAQINKTNADTDRQNIENKYLDENLSTSLAEKKWDFNYKQDVTPFRKQIEENNKTISDISINLAEQQEDLNNIIIKLNDEKRKQAVFETENQARLFNVQIEEIQSRVKLNNAMSLTEVHKQSLLAAETYGQNLANQFTKMNMPNALEQARLQTQLLKNNINKAYYEARNERYQSKLSEKQNNTYDSDREHRLIQGYLGVVSQCVGTAVGLYTGSSMVGVAKGQLQLAKDKFNASQSHGNMNGYSTPFVGGSGAASFMQY